MRDLLNRLGPSDSGFHGSHVLLVLRYSDFVAMVDHSQCRSFHFNPVLILTTSLSNKWIWLIHWTYKEIVHIVLYESRQMHTLLTVFSFFWTIFFLDKTRLQWFLQVIYRHDIKSYTPTKIFEIGNYVFCHVNYTQWTIKNLIKEHTCTRRVGVHQCKLVLYIKCIKLMWCREFKYKYGG